MLHGRDGSGIGEAGKQLRGDDVDASIGALGESMVATSNSQGVRQLSDQVASGWGASRRSSGWGSR
jgi:hypothetical protein